jgi:hypothetical protein
MAYVITRFLYLYTIVKHIQYNYYKTCQQDIRWQTDTLNDYMCRGYTEFCVNEI